MDEKRRRFEADVLPHLDAAYRLARWLLRSRQDADDVVQDAVLRAFRAFDQVRGSDARPWLLAIVRNCALTAIAGARRHPLAPLPEEHDPQDGHAMVAATPDPQAAAMDGSRQELLARLLASLPQDQREVLVLREVEDMSYLEIAAVIDAPLGTVMSRLARARRALQARWQHHAGDEHDAVP